MKIIVNGQTIQADEVKIIIEKTKTHPYIILELNEESCFTTICHKKAPVEDEEKWDDITARLL